MENSARIDFLNGAIVKKSSVVSRGSCVSISDSLNNLLFYAHTLYVPYWNLGKQDLTAVFNSKDSIMVNGIDLIGRGWYKELIMLPHIDNNHLFLLFQAPVTGNGGPYYSIIDMNADSARGAVIQKNVQLQGQNFYTNDGLAAIKHGNGRDWWVLVRDWKIKNIKFYFYLISPEGIALSHTQDIGASLRPGFYRIEPSMDRNKIACCTNNGLISVFDIDR
ncbi:MAG: hypothetical protein IPO27_00115 [Bacteroidetes bacterium]|nr:hypothetical protein [Bacteroidota bacterium]